MQPSTTSNLRIVKHIVLGVDMKRTTSQTVNKAANDLVERVTRLIGGVTDFIATGNWTEGTPDGDYDGKIECDYAINLILTMTMVENEQVWPIIQQEIAAINAMHGLGCEHVHVMCWVAQSEIFQLAAANDDAEPQAKAS